MAHEQFRGTPEFGHIETAGALVIDAASWKPPTGESFDIHWFDWQQN